MNNPFEIVATQLVSTIHDASSKLRAFTDADVSAPLGPGKWSRKQIMGHLIDSASNNHQRFVRSQLRGEHADPGYDQEGCIRVADPNSLAWPLLLDLWTNYNLYLAHILARIPAEAAGIHWRTGEKPEVTLQFVAEDYLRHLKQHLVQAGLGE